MGKGPSPRGPGIRLYELARYLIEAVAPGEVKLTHIWTPELELILLRPKRGARRRLRERDLEALARVIEGIAARAGRDAVVEVR